MDARLAALTEGQQQLRAAIERVDARAEQQGKDLRAAIEQQGRDLRAAIEQQGKDLRAAIEHTDARITAVADKMDAKIGTLRNYIVIPVALVLLAAILAHFVPGL